MDPLFLETDRPQFCIGVNGRKTATLPVYAIHYFG